VEVETAIAPICTPGTPPKEHSSVGRCEAAHASDAKAIDTYSRSVRGPTILFGRPAKVVILLWGRPTNRLPPAISQRTCADGSPRNLLGRHIGAAVPSTVMAAVRLALVMVALSSMLTEGGGLVFARREL